MSTFHDYESLGWITFHNRKPPLLEAFKGSDIVDWHGRIEQSLVNLLNDAEKASNQTYANRLRAFLETWRENPIDGSLNRETIVTLSAAAKQWSREDWDLQSYFLSLHTKLRQLIASEEELPRDVDTSRNDPLGGTHGGAGGAPPMSPSFGPSAGEPEGLDADLGGGGGTGMPADAADVEGEGLEGDLGDDLGGEPGVGDGSLEGESDLDPKELLARSVGADDRDEDENEREPLTL